MSETKLEHKQAKDEDERKLVLENLSTEQLIEIVTHETSNEQWLEFRNIITQFIIENNLDLKYFN